MRTFRSPLALAAGLVLAGPPTVLWAGPPDAPPAACCPPAPTNLKAWLATKKPTPPVVEPAPLGLYYRAPFEVMVTNGTAARMTLYDYDFVPGRELLSPRGRDRVRQIAHLAECNGFPVVVQRVASPQLAEARRLAVTAELLGINSAAAGRVVVGTPTANPLSGVEAELIYMTLMQQTQSGGTLPALRGAMDTGSGSANGTAGGGQGTGGTGGGNSGR